MRHVAEKARAAPRTRIVMQRLRSAPFPDHAAILPHRPIFPDTIQLRELVRRQPAPANCPLRPPRAVKGHPIRRAAHDLFLLRRRIAQSRPQTLAVLQIGHRINPRPRMHAFNELHQPFRCGQRVKIPHQKNTPPRDPLLPCHRPHPVHKRIRLRRWILIHCHIMVCPQQHSLPIRRFQEVAEFSVQQRPFRRSRDQPQTSVFPQRGNVMLRIPVARPLHLFRIPSGNIQNRRRTGNAGPTKTAATLSQQRYKK